MFIVALLMIEGAEDGPFEPKKERERHDTHQT